MRNLMLWEFRLHTLIRTAIRREIGLVSIVLSYTALVLKPNDAVSSNITVCIHYLPYWYYDSSVF